jgi:DNA replication and repair protein RecF
MRVLSLSVRDFRCYEAAAAPLGGGLTVIWGPNGAGKTNLLEALYFGCTGRSCRTVNDREVLRFGAHTARVVVAAEDDVGPHELCVGFRPGEPKRMTHDGAPVERLVDLPSRPLVSVFLPERLELVRGVPALRRAHLDQYVAALWPARAVNRSAYAQALAQRNALLSRIAQGASRSSLAAWDEKLAGAAITLMSDRQRASAELAPVFAQIAVALGLEADPEVLYRPRSRATSAEQLQAELRERLEADLERGFTEHGPHRDDLVLRCAGRALRTYGSQGQQRLGLLALLLAERRVIAQYRGAAPLVLLDDVMSELDRVRRQALVELLRSDGGQAVITTTDLEHVPLPSDSDTRLISVAAGAVLSAQAPAGSPL